MTSSLKLQLHLYPSCLLSSKSREIEMISVKQNRSKAIGYICILQSAPVEVRDTVTKLFNSELPTLGTFKCDNGENLF